MKALAFDIATVTGCAFGVAGEKPRSWVVDLSDCSQNERLSRCLRMTEACITRYGPDVVAVEAPVGGRDANALLIGMVACVKAQAITMGKAVVEYYPASVRKHFLGKALTARDFPALKRAAAKTAIKRAVMARCSLLGWDVQDGNAADACALWDYTCALLARGYQPAPLGGLFHGTGT